MPMTAVLLNILVIAVSLWAIYRGWHLGTPRQLPAMIGWCTGIIAARLACPYLFPVLEQQGMQQQFADGDLAARYMALTSVFLVTSLVVTAIASPLKALLALVGRGMHSRLAGTLLALLRWLTAVSLLLNLWGAMDEDCVALRIADGGDGGVIEEVMHLAPALTDTEDYSELLHRRQLRKARAISLLQGESPAPQGTENTDTPQEGVTTYNTYYAIC